MTTDLGILHTAGMWLERHCEDAIAEARRMAQDMQARDDRGSAHTWLQIIVVIEELQRNGLDAPHEQQQLSGPVTQKIRNVCLADLTNSSHGQSHPHCSP